MDLDKVVKKAVNGDSPSQKYLYEKYKVLLYTLCLRYARDRSEANDILQEGFITIFKDLRQFQGNGNLGGWMRKVMVNTALQYLRKWKKEWFNEVSEHYENNYSVGEIAHSRLNMQELTCLIQQLPSGYRVVFNMFVIEGYSHKEIAEMLQINESTSKTQLFKAKAALRKKLEAQLIT